MKAPRILILACTFVSVVGFSCVPGTLYAQATFTAPELIGRPAATSVTINAVADAALEVYFEYGTTSGVYDHSTSTISSTAHEPIEVVIDGLTADTRYFYRMVYSENGGSTWIERDQHSFHTQRAPGSSFVFTIISDSHMNGGFGNESLYEQTLDNVNEDHPDFHFDLGDTFWMDGVTTPATANERYLAQRQWMGRVSHSAAIFLAPGNHENEEGWNFDDTPTSKALLSVNARKRYYPNPITDGFYSGNDDPLEAIEGDHLREDYYAWEWGDTLFVVIDPYHYTLSNPYSIAGGEDNDEGPGSGDRWDWTLGKEQFDWLKQTLEYSNAKFKFVFAHHMLGGLEDFVRGGAAAAHMFEWGGYNLDGVTWGFDARRPGWGGVPIHQLMMANGVSAFFYGHDHLYAYQVRDGIVYQEVPSPGLTGQGLQSYYIGSNGSYTLELLPSPGHLRISVSPSQATVEYVQSADGVIAHSYDSLPTPYLYGDYWPTDCDVDGSDLAEWIVKGAPAGRDIVAFAGSFGKTVCQQ